MAKIASLEGKLFFATKSMVAVANIKPDMVSIVCGFVSSSFSATSYWSKMQQHKFSVVLTDGNTYISVSPLHEDLRFKTFKA